MDRESLQKDVEQAYEDFDALDLLRIGVVHAAGGKVGAKSVYPQDMKYRDLLAGERIREIELVLDLAKERIHEHSRASDNAHRDDSSDRNDRRTRIISGTTEHGPDPYVKTADEFKS